ncbi:MAG: AMMECR1 domain-containing protein [Parcubacteria group bacterium]
MLKKFFSRANEFYHTAQLDTFFMWLTSKTFPEPFFILIDLPLQTEVLDAHRRRASKEENTCGFIICQTNKRVAASASFPQVASEASWHRIWYAAGIEIWENKDMHRGTLPLRFGLSLSEKEVTLRFARKTMESFFDGERVVPEPDFPAHRAGEKTLVDVGVWINGEIRGSVISPLLPFIDALRHASRGALCDARMKPVEQDELENARIEVTFMSDLMLPLREQDIENGKIDACRGYYATRGDKRGWYLPMTFNGAKFKDMSGLKSSLIKEKAGIAEESKNIPLYTFQTEGWMEDGKHALMLLEGSVAYAPLPPTNSFLQRVKTHGDQAAEWLVGTCDAHDAMPLYIDPLYKRTGRMDWGRLANASYALAAFGVATSRKRYLRASEQISEYIQRHIFNTREPGVTPGVGSCAYLLHAALARSETHIAPLLEYVKEQYARVAYRPIMHAVLASLFAKLTLEGKGDYRAESFSLADGVFADFKKNKFMPGTQLALYPELIYTFQLLHLLTGQSLYLLQSEEVATWLIRQQLPNGSFPIWPDSSFAYTRGTGKIFEGLARHPGRYDTHIEKSFEWLVRLQYTPDSLYFTDPSFKTKVAGGFRHDHANTEAWIDSAAHFLLGAAYLLDTYQTSVDK